MCTSSPSAPAPIIPPPPAAAANLMLGGDSLGAARRQLNTGRESLRTFGNKGLATKKGGAKVATAARGNQTINVSEKPEQTTRSRRTGGGSSSGRGKQDSLKSRPNGRRGR